MFNIISGYKRYKRLVCLSDVCYCVLFWVACMHWYSTSTRMELYTHIWWGINAHLTQWWFCPSHSLCVYIIMTVFGSMEAVFDREITPYICVTDCLGMLECGGVCLSPSLQSHIWPAYACLTLQISLMMRNKRDCSCCLQGVEDGNAGKMEQRHHGTSSAG